MANPDDVKRITGYTIGGVSPVGHLSKLKIYIDTKFREIYNTCLLLQDILIVCLKIEFIQLIKLT